MWFVCDIATIGMLRLEFCLVCGGSDTPYTYVKIVMTSVVRNVI
jgi:hypothetical protein